MDRGTDGFIWYLHVYEGNYKTCWNGSFDNQLLALMQLLLATRML
jgi:hypothetical protein